MKGCGMDSIYIIFYSNRINRIVKIFFACGEGPSAEGRIILIILLILSDFFLKNKNPFLFFFQNIEFLFRFNRLFFWPAAGLNLETVTIAYSRSKSQMP